MAGDWIKFEVETPDKPEVVYIAGLTKLDPDAVVGKLLRVWTWFDKHTTDGNALGVTHAFIDRIAGCPGFAEAMALAGWLKQSGLTLTLPNFGTHNGETAKKRALTAKRQSRFRNVNDNAPVTQDALPREEKRREEEKSNTRKAKKTPIPADFGISDRVRAWALKGGHNRLTERLEHFVGYARRSGARYADWDAAFECAVREDWAKLNGRAASGSPGDSVGWLEADEVH